ncbi:hypothetical protein EXIGLDRAFT_722815 [Exidia glandulosa HHB12029]|uniref:Integral membrane protein n=1 Tax=Exidia glandulosa HHB12029 TaxID=1314781 RepID=A0A165F372_EXIGL|nr:hypothetical protein EXIGLDRAFT_722815 [Exidia glandulosa HHB12029]
MFRQTHAVVRHPDGQEYHWSARVNRKGRHRLEHKHDSQKPRYQRTFLQRVSRIFTAIEYWNISWWVAIIFTIGSIVWCINGVYAFVPFVNSGMAENQDAVSWTSWLGATIFEIGGILAFVEAWTVDDDAYFGWHLFHHKQDEEEGSPPADDLNRSDSSQQEKAKKSPEKRRKSRDLGLWAAAVQMVAATIFWMAGWTSLPVIFNSIKEKSGLLAGVYWTPQIAGIGFMISGLLFMLEVQKKWYKPELANPGWHVGFWNVIGGLGFFLCAAFGYSERSWRKYQSSLSTFWGSWAFLISSIAQWYEAVNPVQPKGV